VIVSGLEEISNAGPEQMIDLIDARMDVAESSMANLLAGGVYADGTGSGGKEVTGLNAAVPVNPATGVYGGIDRATWSFWRSQATTSTGTGGVADKTSAQVDLNTAWAKQVRGSDRPDLIIMDNFWWEIYLASLQAQQRFTDPGRAKLGFPSIAYMDADVVLDGGLGGFCPTKTCFLLNTKYIYWRPARDRNMVPLDPSKRYSTNQDASVAIIAWAGNMTTSNSSLQGRLTSA
jgi:hypothetical protein